MYLGTESIRKEENGRNMLEIVPGYDRIEEVKALFSEYTEMLVSLDPFFHLYLDIQHYDDEEKNPAKKYRMPDGRLYIAMCNGKAAGCIALRKLNENDGELKRLYVRPEFRGKGIASMLTKRIIEDAEKIGYKWLYLDTLPELDSAVRLYQKLGFEFTTSYNDSPVDKTLFMRKKLEIHPLPIH